RLIDHSARGHVAPLPASVGRLCVALVTAGSLRPSTFVAHDFAIPRTGTWRPDEPQRRWAEFFARAAWVSHRAPAPTPYSVMAHLLAGDRHLRCRRLCVGGSVITGPAIPAVASPFACAL